MLDTLTTEEQKLLAENACDEATERVRRKAMKGKHLLYVSGSHLYPYFGANLQAHVKELMEMGVIVHMVFCDENQYYKDAKTNNCFHHAIIADIVKVDKTSAVNIVKACKEAKLVDNYDGVFTPHEATQALGANVQELLGLTGNPVNSYRIAQDKYETRKALEKANLNTVKAAAIRTLDDVENAVQVVGFPMFIKPTTGMGSAGCYKVTTREECEKVVLRTLDDINSNWALSNGRTEDRAPILAETFIEPTCFGDDDLVQEFDCECLFWDGELVYANVVDNWAPIAPYFQDRGFHAPSYTPKSVQEEIIEYCAAAVKALGFKVGNFHMEAWYTKTGPVLIECNPRVGGGSISLAHKKIWNVDPMINFTMAMLGVPINPPRAESPQCSFGFILVNAAKTGVLSESDYLKKNTKNELIVDSILFKKAGDSCRGWDTGVPDWLAQVDFEHKADATTKMVKTMENVMAGIVSAASAVTVAPDQLGPLEE